MKKVMGFLSFLQQLCPFLMYGVFLAEPLPCGPVCEECWGSFAVFCLQPLILFLHINQMHRQMLRLLLKSEKLQVILNFVDVLHHDYNGKRCDSVTRFFCILKMLCQPWLQCFIREPCLALEFKTQVCVCLFRLLHAVKADLTTECPASVIFNQP